MTVDQRDGTTARTTHTSGNLVFTNPPTGSQVLLIDGPSALYPADMPVQMTIQPGVAVVLGNGQTLSAIAGSTRENL
ncbi:MAG: hypothetical protein OEY77_15245, partial [Nitrospira sp.]|nr:hypothetical protein [Nitrospira sp.]